MKLYDYQLLSEHEQKDLLYTQGIYVGKRKSGVTTVVAYQLEDFYVEIYYRVYRKYISRMRCFSNTVQLEPYLEQMDVEELIKTELKK